MTGKDFPWISTHVSDKVPFKLNEYLTFNFLSVASHSKIKIRMVEKHAL